VSDLAEHPNVTKLVCIFQTFQCLKFHTSSEKYTAQIVHDTGLAEVKRIESDMKKVSHFFQLLKLNWAHFVHFGLFNGGGVKCLC
jgi:hypothetical protein